MSPCTTKWTMTLININNNRIDITNTLYRPIYNVSLHCSCRLNKTGIESVDVINTHF